MATAEKTIVTVEATIQAPIDKVWKLWTEPWHIVHWNFASDDWQSPKAENDLKAGGKFLFRMEAKDGSFGFDFEGTYDEVIKEKRIAYTIADGRKVEVLFKSQDKSTLVIEKFEAEQTNPIEMQQGGWQAILNNFKKYAESADVLEKMHFEILIHSSAKRVYECMIGEQTYRQWTKGFNETSHFKGSWDKGSKILFLGINDKGEEEGMVSTIKENIPNKFISIDHLGMLMNGKEITSGPEVEGWAGALENYTFTEEGGKTLVGVDVDVNAQHKSFFSQTWPNALQKLKEICEQK